MPGSKDSEVHGETVAPEAIEFLCFDKHPHHNAIWDMAAAPGGLVYIGLCNEGLPGLCAQLYVYDIRRRALRHAFSVGQVTHDDVSDGHMPQSKFHTNMSVGRDGRLYAPTHTTAPGIGHEFWDIEQLFDDRDAAYPGSHYIVYDPQTGRAEDLGIPVPRDSTYGGVFDPERGVHYMITYLRGRLYAFEPPSGRVRDLGRVNMDGQCCLFRDREGRIFGTEADGHLWRYDPDRDRLERLNVRMPRPPDREHLITALQEGDWGPDGKFYATALYEGRLWSYDPFDGREGRFEDLGMGWGERQPELVQQSLLWCPKFAPDGCIYYGFAGYGGNSGLYNLRVVRYDPVARTREDLGFVYDRGTSSILFGSGAVGSDGRIYWGDGCSALRPARLVIFDPARARGRERGGPRVTLSTRPAAQSDAGAARAEAARQKEARSGDFKVDESRLDLIHLYRDGLPAGECAVTAMACARSNLYAATSGKRCHILRIVARRVREVLTIPRRGRVPALVIGAGRVWAAFSPEGKGRGALLELSPGRGRRPAIDLPPGTSSVLNMIRCGPGRLVLLTGDGTLLEYATRKRRPRKLATLPARPSPALALDRAGRLWGAVEEGFLYRLDPGSGRLDVLPRRIPSSKGCEYSSVWESAAGGGRWPIYGGTNEGFLFRLDARAGRAVNLGKPAVARGLRCLAVSKSGIVYGMTGEPEGLARLFRYSPADGFTDLGRPVLSQKALWRGHRFSAAACGPAGAIVFGEDDTQSHLWVYDAG